MNLTPQEVREKAKEGKFAKDLQVALETVEERILKAVEDGKNKELIIRLFNTMQPLGNLYYMDDKEEAVAKELLKRGFDCKKESSVIGGVLQNPRWNVYFI